MPRLFEKFNLKILSRNGAWPIHIKEHNQRIHGGRIWSENNNNVDKDGKEGSTTFYFSLPLVKKNHQQPNLKDSLHA